MSRYIVAGLVAAALYASGPAYPKQVERAHEPSGMITQNVEVTSKSGTPVQGLTQADFTLLDNGVAASISSFRAESRDQEPVEVILLFDAVNAPFQTLAYERNQVDSFLHANGGKLPVPFTVAFVTDKGAQILNGYSRDGNELSKSIDSNAPGLREITRAAGFWGASERFDISLKAARQVLEYASKQPGRNLLLWISPGWPLLSGPNVTLDSRQQEQVFNNVVSFSNALREGNVTLYSFNPLGAQEPLIREDYYRAFTKGVTKPSQTDLADLSVQVLALQSGGLALNTTDIGGMIRRALADSESWYEVTFAPGPPEHSSSYHHIELKIDKPGDVARTRDGYYSQP